MLNRKQAQTALKVLGRPTFINKRKDYRTWKWYCRARDVEKELKKRRIPIHSLHKKSKDDAHPWVPGHVTLALPLDFSLKDFEIPTAKPAVTPTEELRMEAHDLIKVMGRQRLIRFIRNTRRENAR